MREHLPPTRALPAADDRGTRTPTDACRVRGLRALWTAATLLLCLGLGATASADEEEEATSAAPEPVLIPGALDTRPSLERRLLVPPVLLEERGDVTTRAVFPFYFEKKAPGDHQRLVAPYFWQRSKELNADVALGLFWWLRGPDRFTLIIPPLYSHRRGENRAYGLAPLFAQGRRGDARYTVIPPLLTFARQDEDSLQQFYGPLWRVHGKRDKWWGLFPLLWGKRGMLDSMFLMPPLYFRFTDDDGEKRTNVVPPFYHKVRGENVGWGLPPLIARLKGPNVRKTTVPLALFHLGRIGDRLQLLTPLFAYFENEDDGYLAVTPAFQWKRGPKGNANAIAPFFFQTWDDRDMSKGLVLAPFFWHFHDPANDTLIIPPFMGRRYRHGLSRAWWFPLAGRKKSLEEDADTWWVAPTFHYAHTPDSLSFNIHPLWYFHREPEKRHYVLAPLYFDFRDAEKQTLKRVVSPLYFDFRDALKQKYRRIVFPFYWDFENRRKGTRSRVAFPLYFDMIRERQDKRSRVAFPVYWSFREGDTTRTVSLNVFHKRVDKKEGTSWKFHFIPLFSVGREPNGKSWEILHGLGGYERRGEHRRMKLFWIPINLD